MLITDIKTKAQLTAHIMQRLICMGVVRDIMIHTGLNRIFDDLRYFTIINTGGKTRMLTKQNLAEDIANKLLTEDCLNETDCENILQIVTEIVAEQLNNYIVIKGEVLE